MLKPARRCQFSAKEPFDKFNVRKKTVKSVVQKRSDLYDWQTNVCGMRWISLAHRIQEFFFGFYSWITSPCFLRLGRLLQFNATETNIDHFKEQRTQNNNNQKNLSFFRHEREINMFMCAHICTILVLLFAYTCSLM